MSVTIYNALPLILKDGDKEHLFTVKVNPSTESFRLETGAIRRSVFIGRRMFNNLLQLIRNEYGTTMGRIQYRDHNMKKGSASTMEDEQFHFEILEGNELKVIIANEESPSRKMSVTVLNESKSFNSNDLHKSSLIPSILATLIFYKEASLIA